MQRNDLGRHTREKKSICKVQIVRNRLQFHPDFKAQDMRKMLLLNVMSSSFHISKTSSSRPRV